MGRRLRTKVPTIPDLLKLQLVPTGDVAAREQRQRANTKAHFHSHHRASNLPELYPGDEVWVRDTGGNATVSSQLPQPHSYSLVTDGGTNIRRNRQALVRTSVNAEPDPDASQTIPATTTRAGRTVKAPQRLITEM